MHRPVHLLDIHRGALAMLNDLPDHLERETQCKMDPGCHPCFPQFADFICVSGT